AHKTTDTAACLDATRQGTEHTATDLATIDQQIASHKIALYVYNSQNTTPDVARQIEACKAAGIPVTTITETLVPVGTTFQGWQTNQLDAIKEALVRARETS